MINFLKENKKEIIVGLIIFFVGTAGLKIFTPIFSIIWNYLKSLDLISLLKNSWTYLIVIIILLVSLIIYIIMFHKK